MPSLLIVQVSALCTTDRSLLDEDEIFPSGPYVEHFECEVYAFVQVRHRPCSVLLTISAG
jgi:hypothetical protein